MLHLLILVLTSKAIGLFYVAIAKAYSIAIGKKQIAYGIVARGVNKLQLKT